MGKKHPCKVKRVLMIGINLVITHSSQANILIILHVSIHKPLKISYFPVTGLRLIQCDLGDNN